MSDTPEEIITPKVEDDLVARLRAKNADWQERCDEWVLQWKLLDPDKDWSAVEALVRRDDRAEAADLIAEQAAEIERLSEGLRPFAELADDYLADTVNFDDATILAGRMTRRGDEATPPRVTFADFRRARALLQDGADK